MRVTVIRQDEYGVLAVVRTPAGSDGQTTFRRWAADPGVREHLDADALAAASVEELEVVELEKRNDYAEVVWAAEDVLSVARKRGLDWTAEDAEEWLRSNEGHIADRLTELGWDVIDALLTGAGPRTGRERKEVEP